MPTIDLDTTFTTPGLPQDSIVLAFDNFDDDDGPLAGRETPVGDRPWLRYDSNSGASGTQVNAFITPGGELIVKSTTGNPRVAAVVDCGVTNFIYDIDIPFVHPSAVQLSVLFNFEDINNHMVLMKAPNTGALWTLYSRVAGTTTTLHSVAGVLPASGDHFRTVRRGSKLAITLNGDEWLPPTSFAGLTAGGKFGVGMGGVSSSAQQSTFDNFTVKTIGTEMMA